MGLGMVVLVAVLAALIGVKFTYDAWTAPNRNLRKGRGGRPGMGRGRGGGRRALIGSDDNDPDYGDYDSDDGDDGTLAAVTADMVADRLLRMADRYDNAGDPDRARQAREAAEQARGQSASEAAALERQFSGHSGGHGHGHSHSDSSSSSSDSGSSSSSSSSYTDNS